MFEQLEMRRLFSTITVSGGNTASVPPAACQAIRIYSRFFNLNLP